MTKNSFLFLILCLGATTLLLGCQEESTDEKYLGTELVPTGIDLDSLAALYLDEEEWNTLKQEVEHSWLQGKSIAFLGGSLAALPESSTCKEMYSRLMHTGRIVSYARGGLGYATQKISLQDYLPNMQRHDVYILWCSTNDYCTGIPVGEPTDYTEKDGYDSANAQTQCGGLNKCIHAIRIINPDAQIIGFTSLRFFGTNGNRPDGYADDTIGENRQDSLFCDYVQRQRKTFERANIPFYDQYNCGLFDINNYYKFYLEDGFHLKSDGYFLLGCQQLRFFINLVPSTKREAKSNHYLLERK